jgi:hypothetical protein
MGFTRDVLPSAKRSIATVTIVAACGSSEKNNPGTGCGHARPGIRRSRSSGTIYVTKLQPSQVNTTSGRLPAGSRMLVARNRALSPCGRGQRRNSSRHGWVRGRGRDPHPPLLLKRRAALSRTGRGHGAARCCSVSRSATARRGRRDAVARTARRCWDMGEASLRAEGEAIQAQRRNLDCFVTLLRNDSSA